MMIPTIFEWLERFDAWRGVPAVYVLLLTAVVILLAWDWRVTVFALMVHYLVAGLLFADVLDPRLALVKVLVGLFVCLILYMTARQVGWGRLPVDVAAAEAAQFAQEQRLRLGRLQIPATLPRRLILTPLLLLLVLWLAQNPAYALPGLPETLGHLTLAVYGLVGLGLLAMAVTTEPWSAGLGLFLFLTGFELYYSVLEQSALVLGLLAAANLLVALVLAYLTQGHRSLVAVLD